MWGTCKVLLVFTSIIPFYGTKPYILGTETIL